MVEEVQVEQEFLLTRTYSLRDLAFFNALNLSRNNVGLLIFD